MKKKPVSVPQDAASFAEMIRAMSRKIAQLKAHVAKQWRDRPAMRRLEKLIDTRGLMLEQPPASINDTLLNQLREEVKRG